MKRLLLSLAAVVTAVAAWADDENTETTIYKVTVGEEKNTATQLTIADDSDDCEASATGISVSGGLLTLELSTGSSTGAVVDKKTLYGIKIASTEQYILCNPTEPLQGGDVIYVTGFINSEGGAASTKVVFDEITVDETLYLDFDDDASESSFANLADDGVEEASIKSYMIPYGTDTYDYFLLKRIITSDGTATALLISDIEIVRTGNNYTPESGEEDGSTALPTVEGKETVSVEYFTLTGAKVGEPAKGVNIVRTTYSDGTIATTKLFK